MIALYFVLSVIACGVIHEFGHWLMARLYGEKIKFKFAWGRYYVPRFTWTMPAIDPAQQCVIALSGFGLELLVSILAFFIPAPLTWLLLPACAVHLFAYNFYAGADSDWDWVKF